MNQKKISPMSTQKTTTALQDLIVLLEDCVRNDPDYPQAPLIWAKSLLPKEREMIERVFTDGKLKGCATTVGLENHMNASDYYTQTFDQHGTR